MKELCFWINSIQSRSTGSKIILVGTHLDRMTSESEGISRLQSLTDRLAVQFPNIISASHCVASSGAKHGGIKDLVASLSEIGMQLRATAPAIVELARIAMREIEATLVASGQPPVVSLESADTAILEKATKHRIMSCDQRLRSDALEILQLLGNIFVLWHPVNPLSRKVVVLNPQWLARLLSSIVTTRSIYIGKDAILYHHDLPSIWNDIGLFPPPWFVFSYLCFY